MSKNIKNNQLQILKINNKTYLPFQLHQLPKYFNNSTTDYFNLKLFKDKLTFNKQLPQQYKLSK